VLADSDVRRIMAMATCVIAAEMHRVFGLGAAEIGLIMGAMPLASALVQVPVGLACDRFGTRRTVSVTTLVGLLGTLVLALADGATGLAVGRFLIGAGLSAVVTALLLLTMRWAPPERYASVAATVLASASMAGGLLATVPLGFFLQRTGWTATFLGISLMTLVVIGLCATVMRDGPPGSEARSTRPESLTESLRGLLAVLADVNVRRIMVMATCVIAPCMCVGGLWAGP
jgi:predicted MFS family arabinose efflux permease